MTTTTDDQLSAIGDPPSTWRRKRVVAIVLGAVIAALGGRDDPTIEPWSGWSVEELGVALIFGTPGRDGRTVADVALDDVHAACAAFEPGHLVPRGWRASPGVSVAGGIAGGIPEGCDSPSLLTTVGGLDAERGLLLPPGHAEVVATAPTIDPGQAWFEDVFGAEHQLRPGDRPIALAGGRTFPAAASGPDLAVAMVLGRYDGRLGFAVHAVREHLEAVCGETAPGFDAVVLGEDEWVVTATVSDAKRCPGGQLAIGTVDLATGLLGPPAMGGDGAEGLPGASSVLSPWLDRVRAAR